LEVIMKRSYLSAALVLSLVAAAAPTFAGDSDPIAVVQMAYVDGIHRNSDAAAMRAGFHEDFIMFVNADEGVMMVTRDDWAARIEKAGSDPERKTYDISAEVETIGESGNAAVVKVELSRDGKHVFTDFLSLYKTPEGWKIIAKIYQRQP
jgi:ketosteroid isomerase-like protein